MLQIKFRGKLENGKFVYGDLVQWGGRDEPRICSWDNGVIYDIVPNSAAQLCGYDSNGNEVYTGNIFKVMPPIGSEPCLYEAQLMPVIMNAATSCYFRDLSKFSLGEVYYK